MENCNCMHVRPNIIPREYDEMLQYTSILLYVPYKSHFTVSFIVSIGNCFVQELCVIYFKSNLFIWNLFHCFIVTVRTKDQPFGSCEICARISTQPLNFACVQRNLSSSKLLFDKSRIWSFEYITFLPLHFL